MAEKTKAEYIREMSNKSLLYHINKRKQELADPEKYGKHGTSRWVTESEFHQGYHQDFKRELERRKKLGKISKNAGRTKQKRSTNIFGMSSAFGHQNKAVSPFRFKF
jgi:hypothetical protein